MADNYHHMDLQIMNINRLSLVDSPSTHVFFLLHGNMHVVSSQTRWRLAQSDIVLIPPLYNCDLLSGGDNSVLAVRIGPDMPGIGFLRLKSPLFHKAEDEMAHPHSPFQEILSEIAYAHFKQGTAGRLKLFALVYDMLDRMLSRTSSKDLSQKAGTGKTGNPARAHEILRYIDENYRLPITLADVAANQFMTPQYLSRTFKNMMGTNFYSYLSQVRLDSAVLDLVSSDETITKIAIRNGFPNVLAFNRLFNEKYGTSPNPYRKASRHKKQLSLSDAQANVKNIDFESVQDYLDTYIKSSRMENIQATSENTMEITVDVSVNTPLRLIWDRLINIGFASDISKSNMKTQMEMLQGRMNFAYARFQGIFNEDPTIVSAGNTKRSYYNSNAIIDYLTSIHLLPFIEIGNKPKKINRKPKDNVFNEEKSHVSLSHGQMEAVFREFLKHSINRYGVSEVGKWKFEFWAEHDEKLQYGADYLRSYMETYGKIHRIVKTLVPTAQFGGPGFNMAADMSVLRTILEGLKEQQITPDFVSLYSYPYTIIQAAEPSGVAMDEEFSFLWGKQDYLRNLKNVKKFIRQIHPGIRHFYITEWNVDYSNRNFLHDACFKAPFILQTILDSHEQIDGLGYWLLSDISSEYGDSDSMLYGGAGLINRSGIRKPGFFAYDFLSKLGGHLVKKGDNHIVTCHSETEYEVLVFNYKYLNHYALIHPEHEKDMRRTDNLLEDQEDLVATFTLQQVVPGRYSVKHDILNSEHGSLLDEWLRLNAPDNIEQSEIDYLRSISIPKREIFEIHSTAAQELILSCTLKPNEVDLFLIRLELD